MSTGGAFGIKNDMSKEKHEKVGNKQDAKYGVDGDVDIFQSYWCRWFIGNKGVNKDGVKIHGTDGDKK